MTLKRRRRDGRRIDERTKGKDDYCTPEWFLKLVAKLDRRGIGLDVAAARGKAPINKYAKHFFRLWLGENALAPLRSWRSYGLDFINPPYGTQLKKFARKAVEEFSRLLGVGERSDQLVMLVPGRGGSQWFRLLWRHCDALLICDRRFTFVGESQPAKFPQAVFYFGNQAQRFAKIMGDLGIVLVGKSVRSRTDLVARSFRVTFTGDVGLPVRLGAWKANKTAQQRLAKTSVDGVNIGPALGEMWKRAQRRKRSSATARRQRPRADRVRARNDAAVPVGQRAGRSHRRIADRKNAAR